MYLIFLVNTPLTERQGSVCLIWYNKEDWLWEEKCIWNRKI